MALYLKANKTKLFRLVKAKRAEVSFYVPLTKLRLMEYTRSPSGSAHLRWYTEGQTCLVDLMSVAGRPVLAFQVREDGRRGNCWQTVPLTVEELREFGMVEER